MQMISFYSGYLFCVHNNQISIKAHFKLAF